MHLGNVVVSVESQIRVTEDIPGIPHQLKSITHTLSKSTEEICKKKLGYFLHSY